MRAARLLPSFRTGQVSSESIDGLHGASGRYFQLEWFGLQFAIELLRVVK